MQAEPWSTQSSYNIEGATSINARQVCNLYCTVLLSQAAVDALFCNTSISMLHALLQGESAQETVAYSVQPVTMNPLNMQQGNPSYRMEGQAVTPRASSFNRRNSQMRNSFRASAENRVPPFTADGQYQVVLPLPVFC